MSDYFKLTWLIKYIRGTIHLPLLLGWDESRVMIFSIDATFAVHNDIQSHMGSCLTTGKGSIVSLSIKQKINAESSTEAKLTGVDDAMSFFGMVKVIF